MIVQFLGRKYSSTYGEDKLNCPIQNNDQLQSQRSSHHIKTQNGQIQLGVKYIANICIF